MITENPVSRPINPDKLSVMQTYLDKVYDAAFTNLLSQGAESIAEFETATVGNWNRLNADQHGRIVPVSMNLQRGIIVALNGLDMGLAIGTRRRNQFSPEGPTLQFGVFPRSQMTVKYEPEHGKIKTRLRFPIGSLDHLRFIVDDPVESGIFSSNQSGELTVRSRYDLQRIREWDEEGLISDVGLEASVVLINDTLTRSY